MALKQACPWYLMLGPKESRRVHGCYDSKKDADKAAKKMNKGVGRSSPRWRPVASRPPGVPLSGSRRKRRRRRRR